MTGNVIGDLADLTVEICFQETGLVAHGEIFKGIEEGLLHFPDLGIFGEHQRQFLLELQGT